MTGSAPGAWRAAGPDDAVALRDLERAANLVGLAHVFGERPFPDADVLDRWRATLAEPGTTTRLHPHALVCWDGAGRLRHLAVDPDHWGRGLATEGVRLAVDAGATWLWVLELNHRARRLYAHLGFAPTGRTRAAAWPPYPREMQVRRG